MPRSFLKRHLPSRARIAQQKSLGIFGQRLLSPDVWHLNRRSVSTAAAVGLFLAFFPVPGQMIVGAVLAFRLRCNLALTLAFIWVTNPLTIPPLFFFAYKLGTWVLQVPPQVDQMQLSLEWLTSRIEAIWQPLVVGSVICSIAASALGWLTVQAVWRVSVVQRWEKRRALRRLRGEEPSPPA